MKRILAALIVMTVSSPAFATRSYGLPDCGQWIKDTGVQRKFNEGWLLGWLSGVNNSMDASTPKGQTPPNYLAQTTSANQVILFVDNYCRANPLEDISSAADQLMADLVDKKYKK